MAGVSFIRVQSEDGKEKTWINLDAVEIIRRIELDPRSES
ncbi:hypothetical protein KNP414_00776 [Paenibacillus mucilaginosus KNP414]|uniref:Uncharacterized protein n=1 Tax=Paenibacillus mucilaginosus (strain KNP414) TaxID=1036673 RepID=F8FRB6_PAEMK|nr:hypothetical protein KNP414_00776 [Paenibacillus mucilaginosus KNP414]